MFASNSLVASRVASVVVSLVAILVGLCSAAVVAQPTATVAPAAAGVVANAAVARVASVAPQGEVGEVRQISVRFSAPVVSAGDPRLPAPFTLRCNGSTPAGTARWATASSWLFDLNQPLAAGQRCTLTLAPGFVPLGGPLQGPTEFSFATGAPVVVQLWPEPGRRVEEDQHFLLRLNGPVDMASLRSAVWCEVDGIGERLAATVVEGPVREQTLRAMRKRLVWDGAVPAATAAGSAATSGLPQPPPLLLMACQRPFPAAAQVRLVWGPGVKGVAPAGVASAGTAALVSRRAQRWQWQVRDRFTADFSCERENARAPCLPLRPVSLRFSAPVPRALALTVRLQPPQGAALVPKVDAESDTVESLQFAAPLPENTTLNLVIPATLRDDSGRTLSNAAAFPMAVPVGGMPPLAKFAAAPFGIIEAGPLPGGKAGTAGAANDTPPLLPLTLRHVQADLMGARGSGGLTVKHLPPGTPDATLMRWLGRLQLDHEDQFKTRTRSLLAKESDTRRAELPLSGPLAGPLTGPSTGPSAAASGSSGATAGRATEVIGVPLPQRGYHVVEVESRILGHALLENKAPMYARTGALVTNLAVHFKRGRSSSLVWVTSLDRGRPVAAVQVAVNDCRGLLLWSGTTDAQGMARIPRGFDEEDSAPEEPEAASAAAKTSTPRCLTRDGLFVSARSAAGDDLSFVFSQWNRGIEAWRFNVPTMRGTGSDLRAHTVFDRTLLRVGDTVSMKHFLRQETERGLALPDRAALPTEAVLTHLGSDTEYRVPLTWAAGSRSAQSQWAVPKNATLGVYDVALVRAAATAGPGSAASAAAGTAARTAARTATGAAPNTPLLPALRLASGSLRVEAFRVPLVDARLTGPSGVLVAPKAGPFELQFAAQLSAMSGGPMGAAALQLSALLRPVTPQFGGYEDFVFKAPRDSARDEGAAEEAAVGDGSTVVADKLRSTTNAQGAASFKINTLPAFQGPAELQAELSFADPNGETQSVSQRLRLWPAQLVVGLRIPQWAAERGAVRFTAVLLDTEGKPLVGRALQVQGRSATVYSTRQRIVGGFYAYQNKRENKDLGVLCSGKSDTQGRLHCDASLKNISGEVQLIASATDDAGRSSQAAASAWVAGEDSWWFAQDNDDRIDLLPEKRDLQPGDTARLQVRMPFRQATVLVTVEREGVIDARVMTLSGREPVIELPIPNVASAGTGGTASSWAPNVTVTALALRGRLREAPWWSAFTWGWKEPGEWWRAFRYEAADWRAPTTMVDLAKPSFKLGVAQLKIGLAAQRLDVKVTPDRSQYRVRETVKARVQVSHAGKPLAGVQVAFAAVDEGLLALQPNSSWQLLEGLLQARPWGVETATAQGEIIGRRHYGRKALAPGGGGGRNPTRELFDTLLLWRGTVDLDAQGQAVVEVPLNDSLTRFVLVAVADVGADAGAQTGPVAAASGTAVGVEKFGTGQATVSVNQELQMLPGLAPLAREGDRFEAGFTLRNTTDKAMTVRAMLTGKVVPQTGLNEGAAAPTVAALPALQPQTVNLAAGAAAELRWPVQVPKGSAAIEWEGVANEEGKTGGIATNPATNPAPNTTTNLANDRVKITQAIHPAVPLRVWQASLQPLEGPLNLPTAPPADALPGSRLQVALQSSLGGALPGLQRFFETYPYTCLEQKASRAIALRDSTAWAQLREELPGYLDADGLAHYYPPSPGAAPRGSDRLTAYLISAAHEAGFAWPDATRERMLRGLTAFVEGRIERRFNAPRADLDMRKLSALEALARHGRAAPRQLGSISWTPVAWPTSALLDAWSLLRRLEGPAQAATPSARLDEVQRLVRSRLVAGGTVLKFSTEEADAWWWLMEGPDANAARLVLLASDSAAWKDEVPGLVNGALARQQRGAWSTTTANLWGVLALQRFAARFEAQPVAGRTLLQSGASTAAVDWAAVASKAPAAGSAAAVLSETVKLPLTSKLEARHEGTGRPWLTVQTLAAVPLLSPLNAGYAIQKTITAAQQKQPPAWSRGDIVRVRLEVQARADMSWVVVHDPIPSGATLLGSGLGRDSSLASVGQSQSGRGLLAYEERRAEAWLGHYEWLPRGTQVVEYTMRLNTAGQLNLPPTRVQALYAPEQFGELPNAVWQVLP